MVGVAPLTGREPTPAFTTPYGITTDVLGNLYVTDQAVIRKILPGGIVTTIAGQPGNGGTSDGTLTNAQFDEPWGISTDPYGNIYVADSFNYDIRKVVTGPPIELPRLDGVVAFSNYMRFVFDGPGGSNYCVQTSADLTNWTVYSTNLIPVGRWLTIQDLMTNNAQRYYRAYLPGK